MPFVSYGGSSLVANFALLAILLRISDDVARDVAEPRAGCAMNTGIRRVGIVMIVLFVALVAQLTYLQVGRSNQLANASGNPRQVLRATSGATAARSRPPTASSSRCRRRPTTSTSTSASTRTTTATLFADVVGYESIQLGSVGVENAYASELEGRTFKLQLNNLADAFANQQPVGTVVLTLSKLAQGTAAFALQGKRGSVVVLDVQTGGVLAAYSNPTFDPNQLATPRHEEGAGRVHVPHQRARQPAARRARGASSTRRARRSRP